MTDEADRQDLHALYAENSPYRVRLPGSIAMALEWPTEPNEFACYGVFRSRGELLCTPQAAALPDGTHPFGTALEYRSRATSEVQPVSLQDFPTSSTLALEFLVFEFNAKWTNAKRAQLDLNLTTTRTSLLGWRRGGQSPPLYPRVWPPVLCLLSQERVFALQDEEGVALSEGR